MNESLNQHIDMLVSSLKSPVLNDDDVTELFGLLLNQTGHFQAQQIAPALNTFAHERPALYADIVRRHFEKSKDSAIALLLRQLDDPEVPDDTIDRSIRLAIDEASKQHAGTSLALVMPLLYDLRQEVMKTTTLEMYEEEFEKRFGTFGFSDL